MTSPPDRSLSDLAESVVEEFEAYRNPDGFNELSIVIDNSNRERSTLIVHIYREQPTELADRVEAYLHNHGARTERERVRLVSEDIEGGEYDTGFSRDLTVRAAESVLSPLGGGGARRSSGI